MLSSRRVEADVTIRVHWSDINGECLDLFYRAYATAARRFAHCFNTTHAEDTVTVIYAVTAEPLPRLPCERNWLVP